MAYFESVPTDTGLNRLPSNPCKLLDFQLLELNEGESYVGNSGQREMLAVLLGGKGNFIVNDQKFDAVGGRANVFGGKPHSVYIPCASSFSITAVKGKLEVALPSAPSELKIPSYVIAPEKVAAGVWGAANFSRNFHQILTSIAQPELPAQRLIVGETFMPSGNWSTYPAHKHEKDDLPREAYHEEMYFYKVNPADGFGLTCHYGPDFSTAYIIRDNTIQMIPHGYHSGVSAPGYTTYFLWFLAGNHRTQAVMEDPALTWVARTVPMLKALGH